MTVLEYLSHPLWRAWAETLLHFVWQGTVLGGIAALLLKRLSTGTAVQRYAVALTSLLLMAACLPVTFAVVAWAGLLQQKGSPSIDGSPALTRAIPSNDASPIATGPEVSMAAVTWPEPEIFCRQVVMAWSIGVVALSLRILASWIGMRLLARGRRPVDESIDSIIRRLAARLGLRRVPLVFASARVVDATVVGFLKPMVLLPAAWLVELSPEMVEAVVAHELAHIRRHDLWINLLQRVVETVLFYHPAVWWVSRRLRAEREMCCDELAVSVTHQRLVYATALESVARRRAGLVKPALAVTLGDQDMALLKRIQHILGISATAASRNAGWGPAAVVALALPATLWLGWSSSVSGTKAVASERATVADIFKSGMSEYDADLVIGKNGELRRLSEMFADAAESKAEAIPAKPEPEKKEDRPAPPGPPTEGRPDDERAPHPRGPGRNERRPDRNRRRPPESSRPVRPDDDRSPDDEDDPSVYGRGGGRGGRSAGVPAAGGVRMPVGSRFPPQSRPDDGDDEDVRSPPGRLGLGKIPGPGGMGFGIRVNPPRGRQADEDDPDAPDPQVEPRDEMVRLLTELRHEVEQLRREVRELRDQRRPDPGVGRDGGRGFRAADGDDRESRERGDVDRGPRPDGGWPDRLRPGMRGARPAREGRRFQYPPDEEQPVRTIPSRTEENLRRRGDEDDPPPRTEKGAEGPPSASPAVKGPGDEID